jgi:outer membrane immunogenic protein
MGNSLFAGAAMLLMASTPAWSADTVAAMPVASFNWSGAYLGAVGSYNWGRTNWDFINPGGTNADHHADGGGIGATFGYNWQFPNNVVIGIEGDLSWLDAKGVTVCPNPAYECHSKVTWLGTVRPRLGYAIDRFMPYVTGGAAFGKVKLWSPGGVLPAISESHTAFGWAAGAGVEYAFTDHLTAKLEYLHVDLGKDTYFGGTVDESRGQWRNDSVRIGLNYKF